MQWQYNIMYQHIYHLIKYICLNFFPDIFTDEDFSAAQVTNRELPTLPGVQLLIRQDHSYESASSSTASKLCTSKTSDISSTRQASKQSASASTDSRPATTKSQASKQSASVSTRPIFLNRPPFRLNTFIVECRV